MKTNNILKVILLSLLLWFVPGGVVCVWGAVADDGEHAIAEDMDLQMQESKYYYGTIHLIEEQGFVIDDQVILRADNVVYRTKTGGITSESHFSKGDYVRFLIVGSRSIAELQMAERDSEETGKETNGPKKKKKEGGIQLQNGVWTN